MKIKKQINAKYIVSERVVSHQQKKTLLFMISFGAHKYMHSTKKHT